jgi:hypothetical protein
MGSSLANAGGPSVGNQAAGSSIAAAGLSAYGEILKSQGVAAGDTFKANILEENAGRGQVHAAETGADMSRKLSLDLGNIDAIRAAAHTDPTSPTGAAIRDNAENIGLTQKSIAVDQIMAQSRQEQDEAAYLRSASKSALLSGDISAGADILSALGKAIPGMG